MYRVGWYLKEDGQSQQQSTGVVASTRNQHWNIRIRSSPNAGDHEHPRRDVPGSGKDVGGNESSRSGAGEEDSETIIAVHWRANSFLVESGAVDAAIVIAYFSRSCLYWPFFFGLAFHGWRAFPDYVPILFVFLSLLLGRMSLASLRVSWFRLAPSTYGSTVRGVPFWLAVSVLWLQPFLKRFWRSLWIPLADLGLICLALLLRFRQVSTIRSGRLGFLPLSVVLCFVVGFLELVFPSHCMALGYVRRCCIDFGCCFWWNWWVVPCGSFSHWRSLLFASRGRVRHGVSSAFFLVSVSALGRPGRRLGVDWASLSCWGGCVRYVFFPPFRPSVTEYTYT